MCKVCKASQLIGGTRLICKKLVKKEMNVQLVVDYFVTQIAHHAFAVVAVSLVIRCMFYYYRYHVVLHFSQLEKNKL